VLSPDGRTVYFLSERNGGSFNVYALPPAQPPRRPTCEKYAACDALADAMACRLKK